MRFVLPLLLLLASMPCFAQEIKGQQVAEPGSLVILMPTNVQESRTTWILNHPEAFEQFAVENGKLFIAMPKSRVSFSLLVVPHDIDQPIQVVRHTIEPGDSSGDDPGEEDPGEEPDEEEPGEEEPGEEEPPVQPDKWLAVQQAAKDHFGALNDRETALKLATAFEEAAKLVKAITPPDNFADATRIVAQKREEAFLGLLEMKVLWNAALTRVSDKMEEIGVDSVTDLASALEAVARGLRE